MPFDVGVGILLGLGFAPFGDNVWANVLTGIFFVLLPDADALIYYASKFTGIGQLDGKMADHRELFHYPLVFLAVGSIMMSFINPTLVPIFVAGTLVQFLHDSVGTGWGIPWLYPFSNKRFKFLYQYDLHRAKQPQKLLWVWSNAEHQRLIDDFGDKQWHKNTFQIWKYASAWKVAEFLVLAIALIVLLTR